jgi:hypothetical protein
MTMPGREERLQRYRHLRAINKRQQSDALNVVSQNAMLDCARRLGLARGRTLLLDNPDEMTLVFDLVVHARVGGRSRAIDRYAEKHGPVPGSDEALMLAAARNSRFAVWSVERRHPVIGLHIAGFPRSEELWLIDESLEASCPDGYIFASRLMAVEDFVMTTGAIVPVDELALLEALKSLPRRHSDVTADVTQDPRFSMAIFRTAVQSGIMESVRYIDPTEEDLLEAMQAG